MRIQRVFLCLLVAISIAGTLAAEDQVFFGNLHSHTSYSDGSGKPSEAFRHARYSAHLDFLAITEHNHSGAEYFAAADRRDGVLIATNTGLYTGPDPESLIPQANECTVDGKFVALYGQEYSGIGSGNHINVFDVPKVIDVRNGEFSKLLDWLAANKDSSGKLGLLQFNHPALHDDESDEYGADDFSSRTEWRNKMDAVSQLIEIANGPAMTKDTGRKPAEIMEEDFAHYLNLGFHLAPTADQDNHYFTWGTATNARTGVIAKELTKSAIIEALRKRHAYATEDKNLRVIFYVNGHLCGDRVPAPAVDSELSIEFTIQDDDEPTADYDIEVYADTIGGEPASFDSPIEVYTAEGNTEDGFTMHISDIPYSGGFQYFFFRVTQFDEDGGKERMWSAPIWFEPAGVELPPVTQQGADRFVASKNSGVYHTDPNCRYAKRIADSNRVTGAAAAVGRRPHRRCPVR